ncbi:MAG TPA: 2-oxoisovalerate dehydrogenase [Candidatus Kapabacteria bacterium]
MKSEITFVVEEAEEGGFTAHALGEAIVTEADTMAELHVMIRDAVDCHFEPNEKPKVIHLHFVRDEVIAA